MSTTWHGLRISQGIGINIHLLRSINVSLKSIKTYQYNVSQILTEILIDHSYLKNQSTGIPPKICSVNFRIDVSAIVNLNVICFKTIYLLRSFICLILV